MDMLTAVSMKLINGGGLFMEKGIIKKIKIQDKIMKAEIKSSNGKIRCRYSLM